MNAHELAGMVSDWSDALTLAEVVTSPFLRVTEKWDLHDWEAVDLPGGLLFRHTDAPGHVMESVMMVEPEGRDTAVPLVVVSDASQSDAK